MLPNYNLLISHKWSISYCTTAHRFKCSCECGCSSANHYAWTDPGGWSALSFYLAEPLGHHLSCTLKERDFTNGKKTNFKGRRLFLQIFPQRGIAGTHAMQLSVWLDFTDCNCSALNAESKSLQRPCWWKEKKSKSSKGLTSATS